MKKWNLEFDLNELFARACNETLYYSDSIEFNGVDSLLMGDSDFDVFSNYASEAWNDVFEEYIYLGKGCLKSGFTFNVCHNRDDNALFFIKKSIEDYIVYKTVYRWFTTKQIPAEVYAQRLIEAFRRVKNGKNMFTHIHNPLDPLL